MADSEILSISDLYMSEIDNSIIYYGVYLMILLSISEHPKIPNKSHLLRCGKNQEFFDFK